MGLEKIFENVVNEIKNLTPKQVDEINYEIKKGLENYNQSLLENVNKSNSIIINTNNEDTDYFKDLKCQEYNKSNKLYKKMETTNSNVKGVPVNAA